MLGPQSAAFEECIDFLASSIAPTFGSLMATSFGWRSSFFVLSAAWGLLAIYGLLHVMESAPDSEKVSYIKDLHRIMTDPSLLFLLLTEACILGALFVPWSERSCCANPV